MHLAAAVVFAYGVLRLLEAWGLWRAKAWASWLGCISAAIYLPLDVYALYRHPGWTSWAVLAVNLIVVAVLARDLRQATPLGPDGGPVVAYARRRPSATGESQCALCLYKTLSAGDDARLAAACQRADAPHRRGRVAAVAAANAQPRRRALHRFAFAEVGIAELQARMERGELSSHALTQAYLDRIAAIDDAGPRSMR